MKFDAPLPADFPFFADRPVWLFVVVVLIVMGAMGTLSHFYVAWLHSRFPGFFRPRVLLAILALGIAVIAIGLAINPPSEVQKAVKRTAPK
ncbi:MAG TPA: hypothetical protein VJR30_19850 [Bradyrhizobium sp.]|nr:hypothetical protein [Bradyrhizobium sp.]